MELNITNIFYNNIKKCFFALIIFLFIFSVIASNQVFGEPIIANDEFIVEKVVSGLSNPTTMTFVGDDILVLEKKGTIRLIRNGDLSVKPVLDVNVNRHVERGLLGITSVNSDIYLYFTEALEDGGEPLGNRIYKYNWDGTNLLNPILLKDLPVGPGGFHNGGVLVTGLNNEVFSVIGDASRRGVLQNIPNGEPDDTGVIMRVDQNQPYYAIGIRNSFGLAIDPLTGNLWDTENGPHDYDEINLVLPYFNSGWAKVNGPATPQEISSLPKFKEYQYSNPEFSWERTVAPTGITFVDSESFEDYKNNLFVAVFNYGIIYTFKLNSERTGFVFEDSRLDDLVLNVRDPVNELIFGIGFGGLTDLEVGPDGLLYVVSIVDGAIYKISPKGKISETLNLKKQILTGTPYDKIICKKGLFPILKESTDTVVCLKNQTLKKILPRKWGSLIPAVDYSRIDLNGTVIENVNFIQTNLPFAKLNNANIKNSDFTNATLMVVDMSQSDLSDSKLINANLRFSNLEQTSFDSVNLRSANLAGVNLENSFLKNTDFSNANLDGAYFGNSTISNVSFFDARLERAIFSASKIENANFSNAIVTRIVFVDADLPKSDFSDSNLRGANFMGANLASSDLSKITAVNVNFQFINLENANLSGASLRLSNLSGANLRGADLSKTNLGNATLSGANLQNANLSGANLQNANLSEANLQYANLSGANLENANLSGAKLNLANMSDANLENVNFSQTKVNCINHPICSGPD